MIISPNKIHGAPTALIIHTVATLRGPQTGDISITHARTHNAQISVILSGTLVLIRSAEAAQGLVEAFVAARGHIAQIPRMLPAPTPSDDEPAARTTLAIEWKRRPDYAAEYRTGLNQSRNSALHWVDLYTGPITWRFRDQIALLTTIETFTEAWRTSTAIFLDGAEYTADPTAQDYSAA